MGQSSGKKTQEDAMETMQAFRIHGFGGLDVLRREAIAIPQPGPDEVLVKIAAASLNPVDYKTRAGRYPLVREDRLPFTLGRDFAGYVVESGLNPDDFQKGEAVYAFVGQEQGAFAEYVAIKRDFLARTPRTLDLVAAAAVPLAGLTAWQGLFDHGGLHANQRVLIHAGAGGVGHLAVQFARARGAIVFATASGKGIAFTEALGANTVIDYKSQAFESIVGTVDVVFDLVGGETQNRSWAVLKEGGALVSTISEPSPERAAACNIRAARYTARPDGRQLAEIGQLIDEGKVRVHISKTFPFAQTVEAQRFLEAGHIRGKVVLDRF
jgi:NADPH:quinone reductase-like Zn-dependent oxidoreductase